MSTPATSPLESTTSNCMSVEGTPRPTVHAHVPRGRAVSCLSKNSASTNFTKLTQLGSVTTLGCSAASSPFARQAPDRRAHQPRALNRDRHQMAEGSSTAMEVDDAPREMSHKEKTRDAQIASLPWVEKCAGATSLSRSLPSVYSPGRRLAPRTGTVPRTWPTSSRTRTSSRLSLA